MRARLLLIAAAAIMVSACSAGSPSASSDTSATTKATAAPSVGASASASVAKATAAASSGAAAVSNANAQSSAGAQGVKLTVDGQVVPLQGAVQVQKNSASTILISAGHINGPGQGEGVTLEISSNSKPLAEGFAAADVDVVTFTVYRGGHFSYMSTGRMPNQPVQGLIFAQTSGRLKGSYERQLTGLAGSFLAHIDFDVPFPKAQAAQPAVVATIVPQRATTPAPLAGRQPAVSGQVGQRIEAGGAALTVKSVSKVDHTGPMIGNVPLIRAEAGKTILLVDVALENIGPNQSYSNPFYFKVLDAAGNQYVGLALGDKPLPSTVLTGGAKAEGTVAFQVPLNATGLILSYQPNFLVTPDLREIRVGLD